MNAPSRDLMRAETDGIDLLESTKMQQPLELAVGTLGASIQAWKLAKLQHRPGAGATGIYSVDVQVPDGTVRTEYVCITTSAVPDTSVPVVRLDDGTITLTAWLYPADPVLTGLPTACDSAAMARAAFGSGDADLRMVNYRPLRRAVLEASQGASRVFIKVVRPDKADALLRRHRLLTEAGLPSPELIPGPATGVVLLREVQGTPLAQALMNDGASQLDPDTLLELLDRLPVGVMKLSRRPAWAERAADYARAAAAALPQEQERIFRLEEKISKVLAETKPGPLVPTHGDFYEANLLIDGRTVTGVLDVDSLGPGHRIDDLACLIGHLAVLPAVHEGYVHVPQVMERYLRAFDEAVDPAGLRGRSAGVALSLVAGAKTFGQGEGWQLDALQRLTIAERLAAEAVQLSAASR
ncbi:aminoglycoside phosphotransferase family protein [Crystallibacter degradans]|uniref:aminoglycoside phosphotransferase family protein n=1 Tax=Crystallibacter degradans TaxID=2726743 RepID=UPI001F0DBBF7|nr:aminoglycoside phosphotransferase family protein [Arthrobacter sp. SF27]